MLVRQVANSTLARFAYPIGCPPAGEGIVTVRERDVDRYLALAARHDVRIVAAGSACGKGLGDVWILTFATYINVALR
jgi:hypothetical protein